MKTIIVALDLKHLKKIILNEMKENGIDCNLNHIDVSQITTMKELFARNENVQGLQCADFNGDMSEWNTSNVKSMNSLFFRSNFTGDISRWDVSQVEDMSYMFAGSIFNGDISQWNVGSVKDMCGMFSDSQFNENIKNWNVSNVIDMDYMFINSKFNSDISNWNVENTKSMNRIFFKSAFNQNLENWNVSNVKSIAGMFIGTPIYEDLHCLAPYWYLCPNFKERKKAIQDFQEKKTFNEKLNNELALHSKLVKKCKV